MVNFTFLILEQIYSPVESSSDEECQFYHLILADQLADLPPPVQSSRGEAWQFYISIIKAHVGRSSVISW